MMTNLTKVFQTNENSDLQISGLRSFSAHELDAAILYYLNGLKQGHFEVCYRPSILFGESVQLRVPANDLEHYHLFSVVTDSMTSRALPEFSDHYIEKVFENSRTAVEDGLLNFVLQQKLAFALYFPNGSGLTIVRDKCEGYRIGARSLTPRTWLYDNCTSLISSVS